MLSWFISPLLSGIMSAVLFFLVRRFILRKVRMAQLCWQAVELLLLAALFAGPHALQCVCVSLWLSDGEPGPALVP